jgi:plastocyanin domain-containing protein
MSNKNNKQQNTITVDGTGVLICAVVIIVVAFIFVFGSGNSNSADVKGASSTVVSVSGDKQIVEVTVSGGYSPSTINAKAGVPTIIRMKSDGAYGCERSFRIPSLGISKTLPSSGNTDIEIASQKAGTRLRGSCSMGMYSFVVNFN